MAQKPVQTETLPGECSPDQLRTLFLFEKLTEEQLRRLCQEGHVERVQPGVLFAEGAPADCFYVLVEGTLVTSRRVGPDDVEVGRTSQRGVYTGAYTAYLGDRVPQVYQNTVRVTEPSKFFVLGASCFAQIMTEWFPMPTHLLEGLWLGGQRSREAVGQRERLLALGSLTAGLTHELNNPAAAAVRATVTLRERVAAMRGKLKMLAARQVREGQLRLDHRASAARGRAGRQGAQARPARGVRPGRRDVRLARRARHLRRLAALPDVRGRPA